MNTTFSPLSDSDFKSLKTVKFFSFVVDFVDFVCLRPVGILNSVVVVVDCPVLL